MVDLENGNAFRRLNGAYSTSPDPCFLPKVEGEVLMNRNKDGSTSPFRLASDGMITDAKGNIYAGDYENNSIRKILPNGTMKTIAHDPRILWPDTFSISPDQYLYVIVNQLHQQARFHYVKDLRQKPYSLLRMIIGKLPAPTFS